MVDIRPGALCTKCSNDDDDDDDDGEEEDCMSVCVRCGFCACYHTSIKG